MPLTIQQALAENKKGFHIGNRLILPFKCQLVKLIVRKEIYHEFVGSKDIKVSQDFMNTSIYFRIVGDLNNMIGSYDMIKLIVAEFDADLCDPSTHHKLVCEMNDDHLVDVHIPDEDMIFIE